MSHAAVVLAGLLAFLDLARTAGATTPDDICPAAQDPCLVTVSRTLTSGSDLDFGDRDLIVKLGKSLDVGPGSMTIRARSVKLESSAKILGAGGTISITATAGDIVLENVSGAPKIDVSDAGGGGDLTLVASGGVTIDGYLYAKGGSDTSGDNDGGSIRVVAQGGDIHFSNGGFAVSAPGDGFGGTVELDATGDVRVDAPADALTLAGGSQGGGGECSVLAGGAIAVDQTIDASGGGVSDGGSITLQSGGNTTTTAKLDVTGGATCGAGGSVTIAAGGDVSLGGSVVGPGGGSITQNCGEAGASLDVSANGAIAVSAPIVTAGGAGDNAGDGGDVSIAAGTSLTLIAPINTGGGNDSASDAPVAGDAGDVSLSAGAALTIGNDIDAGGGHASDGSSGYGGDVTLAGCTVGIPAGIEVSAQGDLLGSNTLMAGELATVAGRLLAADFNEIRYRDPLAPPDLTLATLLPPTVPILDPSLPACGTCGDGVLSPGLGEECDDGNTLACDGCSATCKLETCGNGVRECAEECDDGPLNGSPGDSCDSNCHTVPTLVQRLPGRPQATTGCLAEWQLDTPGDALFPEVTQECIDGDPSCDADGTNDGICTWQVSLCTRVSDERLPACAAAAVESINIRRPNPLKAKPGVDQTTASALVGALSSLGPTVLAGSTVLHAGAPDAQIDHCSAPFELLVPHDPGRSGRRTFTISVDDVARLRMRSNVLRLRCVPNPAVCGNGTVELGEQCDDGNTTACDGCSPTCKREVCGNGVVECGEQCDDGVRNGTPGDPCTTTCTSTAPALRIPGGGAKSLDCGLEWSAALDNPAIDRHGLPRSTQSCRDGDPACDFDPRPGSCGFHLWACVAGGDTRLPCAAAQVTSAEVLAPGAKLTGAPADARQALLDALSEIPFPTGPGERCTQQIEVDVAAKRSLAYRTRARFANRRADGDNLRLRCLPAAP